MKFLTLFIALYSISAQALEISFEKDDSLPLVYINVAFKTGSVLDPVEKSGLSNFVGQMMLRGTQSKTKEQIDQAIDNLGARLEVETRSESTIFRGAVLSAQFEAFSEILLDVLTHPTFPETEIQKLKDEVTSKILEAQGKDNSLARKHFDSWFFGKHPYAKPLYGKIKTLKAITQSDLTEFYNKWLRANNILIVGSGDLDDQKIVAFASRLKKDRAGGETAPKLAMPEVPAGRRVLIIDKPDRTQTQINVGQIGVKMDDPEYFPLYLANYAYGGGSFNSRMMVEIRVKRGWSYGAYSFLKEGTQPRLWQYYLFPASKDTEAALKYSLEMLEDFKNKGLSEAEFSLAQRSLVNNAGFTFNTPLKRVENTLTERTLGLPEGFYKTFAEKLQALKLADVNQSVAKFLKPDQLSISVLATASQLKAGISKVTGVDEKNIQVINYSEDP